jgi:succinyl-CoA synthetase beta subunit
MIEQSAMSEHESKQVLAAYGVEVAPERLVGGVAEAKAAGAELGWPVVVKACGPTITHKTERGLVALGITDENALERSAAAILDKLEPADGAASLLVAAMVSGNRELICGVDVNEHFGPVIMVGLGGILAEALGDVVFRALPIDRLDALEMLDDLQTAALLGPFRGEPAADREALAQMLVSVGRAAESVDDLRSLDVNPIIIVDGKPVAVDALIVREQP